jgi:hypothetical protein
VARHLAQFVVAFLLLAILLPPPGTHAQIIRGDGTGNADGTATALQCIGGEKIYGAASRDAPALIARSLAGDGKRFAFRTCTDAEGNTHYFIREPRPNRDGVCRAFQNEIFPGTEQDSWMAQIQYDGRDMFVDIKGWKSLPPDAWRSRPYYRPSRHVSLGFVSNEACPPGADPRYVPLTNVTDGVLKEFTRLLEEAAASPQAAARIFGPPVRIEPPEFSGDFRWLGASWSRVGAIDCDDAGCIARGPRGGSPFISFDTGPGGLRFTKVGFIEEVQ